MSREIYVKTSVLMSQLQITFPGALSSQHADTKGGILLFTETRSYSNWWGSYLLLSRNLPNINPAEPYQTCAFLLGNVADLCLCYISQEKKNKKNK